MGEASEGVQRRENMTVCIDMVIDGAFIYTGMMTLATATQAECSLPSWYYNYCMYPNIPPSDRQTGDPVERKRIGISCPQISHSQFKRSSASNEIHNVPRLCLVDAMPALIIEVILVMFYENY